MPREFNVAGPCRPELHYLIPATRRVAAVLPLIEAQGYFVIHGPRQVGKTTALFGLARELNAADRHVAAVLSCESGRAFGDDPNEAQAHIARHWVGAAAAQLPPERRPPDPPAGGWPSLRDLLQAWASRLDRPLAVFLDEIDALSERTLLTLLADLRAGFTLRPRSFPASLALVGMRDVRDYKIAAGGSAHLGTSSPFNVKVASLLVRNFAREEVEELYEQHTAETGQHFDRAAMAAGFELTDGQPWLVNALAREAVMNLVPDRAQTITGEHMLAAKERLIVARATHLDSLAERLREPRVRAIIQPMLAGEYLPAQVPEDDYDYLLDLGLLKRDESGALVVANPIYREVIPRALAHNLERTAPALTPSWLGADGSLDVTRLLDAFLSFWREHGEPLLAGTQYSEIAPHLVLMAFLHRVVNGRGRITREYATGRGRMDLLLEYGATRLAAELKVWRDRARDPVDSGLAQLDEYLARTSCDHAWLVIFDRRTTAGPLPDRVSAEPRRTPAGRLVTLVRA